MTVHEAPRRGPMQVHVELHHALQRARGRLAVAVATEKKATPLDRRKYYRETDEILRRCVKDLRQHWRSRLELHWVWSDALEALKRLPSAPTHDVARHGEAHQLCQRLREVLAQLEKLSARDAVLGSADPGDGGAVSM